MNSINCEPNSPSETLRRVRLALTINGQPWAVFGGGEVAAFNPVRVIHDFDIITRAARLPDIAARLGIALVHDDHHQPVIQLAGVDIYGRLEIRTPIGPCVFELDQEMAQRIETRSLPSVPWPMPLISREDNIVLKAILQRGPSDGKQDLPDIRILYQAGPLDVDYLKRRIDRCDAHAQADHLLRQMGIPV
jgi:hypothetical protein